MRLTLFKKSIDLDSASNALLEMHGVNCGFEFEVVIPIYGYTRDELARDFQREFDMPTGATCNVYGGHKQYGVADYSRWHFTRDGSISTMQPNYDDRDECDRFLPVEIVSPVVAAKDAQNLMARTYRLLRSLGAQSNKSCGLHFTFSMARPSPDAFNPLLFLLLSSSLDQRDLLESRRRENRYCVPSLRVLSHVWRELMSTCDASPLTLDHLRNPSLGRGVLRMVGLADKHRHVSLNLCKHRRYGLIEYRGFGGNYLENHSPERVDQSLRDYAACAIAACDPSFVDRYSSVLSLWLESINRGLDYNQRHVSRFGFPGDFNINTRDSSRIFCDVDANDPVTLRGIRGLNVRMATMRRGSRPVLHIAVSPEDDATVGIILVLQKNSGGALILTDDIFHFENPTMRRWLRTDAARKLRRYVVHLVTHFAQKQLAGDLRIPTSALGRCLSFGAGGPVSGDDTSSSVQWRLEQISRWKTRIAPMLSSWSAPDGRHLRSFLSSLYSAVPSCSVRKQQDDSNSSACSDKKALRWFSSLAQAYPAIARSCMGQSISCQNTHSSPQHLRSTALEYGSRYESCVDPILAYALTRDEAASRSVMFSGIKSMIMEAEPLLREHSAEAVSSHIGGKIHSALTTLFARDYRASVLEALPCIQEIGEGYHHALGFDPPDRPVVSLDELLSFAGSLPSYFGAVFDSACADLLRSPRVTDAFIKQLRDAVVQQLCASASNTEPGSNNSAWPASSLRNLLFALLTALRIDAAASKASGPRRIRNILSEYESQQGSFVFTATMLP